MRYILLTNLKDCSRVCVVEWMNYADHFVKYRSWLMNMPLAGRSTTLSLKLQNYQYQHSIPSHMQMLRHSAQCRGASAFAHIFILLLALTQIGSQSRGEMDVRRRRRIPIPCVAQCQLNNYQPDLNVVTMTKWRRMTSQFSVLKWSSLGFESQKEMVMKCDEVKIKCGTNSTRMAQDICCKNINVDNIFGLLSILLQPT